MFERFRRQRQEDKEYMKKQIDKLVSDSEHIRQQRIKSRTELMKAIVESQKDNPCIHQEYNVEKLSEFVSDDNKSLGVKRIIAIWITLGYIVTTMAILCLHVFPIDALFQIYLIFSFISTGVILSYFYTSFKMNNIFRPFN